MMYKRFKKAICFIMIFPFILSALAFFSDVSNTGVGSFAFIAGQSTDYMYEVSSELDLRKIANDQYFNSFLKETDKSLRKIIKLLNNITLTADLEMTCDFNMDLNGKTFDLGGKILTVKHHYSADIAIFNGTIVSIASGGKLIFDTPNATHSIPQGVIDTSLIQYLSFDTISLRDRVFSFVEKEMLYGDSGNYYYTDVILPNHYYTYDITFNYTSSDPTVLSNAGKLLNTTMTKAINFSLVITMNTQVFAKTDPITVWVVPLSNKAKWLDIGTELFDRSIAKYLGESNCYYVSTNVLLISAVTYPGITYSFSTANSSYLSGGNTLMASLSSSTIDVTVTATIGGVSGTPFVRSFKATLQRTNYTIVSDAMKVMFPNGSLTFNALTDTYTIPPASTFPGTISFSFMNSATNYLLNNRVISVNTANPPTMTSQLYLNVDFYFNDANSTHVLRRVKLNFNPTDGSDAGGTGTNDYFSDFYFYLKSILTEKTNGLYTYTTFDMPKAYNTAPKFKYRLVTQYANGSTYSGSPIVSVTDNGTTWGIAINTANVPLEDIKITVYYQYTFNAASETYLEYAQTSSFTIPGIVHSGTNITDQNLYNAVKATYCPSEAVLLTASLSASKPLFEVHNNTISNFKGIEYLQNTTGFNFSGCAFAASNFSYITALKNLTSLNLASNGLTNLSSFPLTTNINSLDISANSINRFDYLEKAKALQYLYVYGQTGTLTNYGNNGVYNSFTFVTLSMKAVEVYKANATTKYVPTADEKTAAKVLSGIIYQFVAPSTTAAAGKIPATVAKASAPTATYTLTKTVLTEASATVMNGLLALSTASNGTSVYRLLAVTYGTF